MDWQENHSHVDAGSRILMDNPGDYHLGLGFGNTVFAAATSMGAYMLFWPALRSLRPSVSS